MSVNTSFDSAVTHAPVRLPRRRSGHSIAKDTVVRVVLTTMFYIALWRATGMWYGYPANFDEGVSVDPLPMKIILYSLIPLIGLYVVLEPNRIVDYLRKVPPLVAVVAIACVASLLVSVDFGASIRGFAAVALLTIAPLLFRLRYGNVETFRILTNFMIFTAFANVLYIAAFPHFAIMGAEYQGMVKGLFYHKNLLGQFSAASFIVLISIGVPKTWLTYRRVIRWTAIAFALVLVVVAQSSTAVVMVIVGMTIIIGMRFMHVVGSSTLRACILFFVLIFLGVVSSFIYLGVAESIAGAFGKDLTFSGRTDIWDQLMPLVYDRPFIGHGFAVFRQAYILETYVNLSHTVRSVHSTYLELCLNIGVPGTVAWVVFLVMRILAKATGHFSDQRLSELRSKEIVIIILVMIGAATEAGMMIAPVLMWPLMVVSIPMGYDSASQASVRKKSAVRYINGKAPI